MEDEVVFFYNIIVAAVIIMIEFFYFTRFTVGHVNWRHYLFFAVLAYAAVYFSNAMESALMSLILMIGLLLFWGGAVYKSGWGASALWALLTVEVMQLSFGVCNSLTALISPFFYPSRSYMVGLSFMILSTLASMGLAWLCYLLIGRNLSNRQMKQNQYLLMILTPLVFIFLAGEYFVNTVYGNTVTIDDQGNVLGANHAQMLLIQSFCLGSLYCILYVYNKLLDRVEMEFDVFRLEQETRFQKAYVREAKARYEKTQSFRHDIKNHLIVVRGLLQRREYSKAASYLSGLETGSARLSFPFHTNHPVLDVLLGDKMDLAVRSGIRMECDVKFPAICAISDMDLCTVFANALDNAIHACNAVEDSTLKYVRITGRWQGDFLLLEFINGSLPESVEEKPGIGLSNIRSIAQRYHGAVEIDRTANVFRLCVMLVISQRIGDISGQDSCIGGEAD